MIQSLKRFLLLVLLTGCARARVENAFNPLAIPKPPLICRSVPPLPGDSAQIAIEFRDEDSVAYERQMRASYKTSGEPVLLTIMAIENKTATDYTEHGVVVKFTPGGNAGRFKIENDSAAASLLGANFPSASPASWPDWLVPLNAGERAQAESLARWLWDHRCPSAFKPLPIT